MNPISPPLPPRIQWQQPVATTDASGYTDEERAVVWRLPSIAVKELMRPVLAVVPSTNSFEQIWPSIAGSVGAELRFIGAIDAHQLRDADMIVIAAGGAEDGAVETLLALPGHGVKTRASIAVVGSVPDHRLSILLLKHGADNYFSLPAELAPLRAWIVERIERSRGVSERESIVRHERAQYDYSRIIGRSEALRHVLDITTRITPHREGTVLLTGETGTGKELIARAIHNNGPDADQPFVEINCSAIPGALLESELFGHERGAFTDARTAKPGLFEVAQSGTVFLDEIGELPLQLQAKLLRVLEEKSVRRLGATTSRDISARVIAATHVDLAAAVREHHFREDLYYRLNVVRITLPPLRERREDIEPLAEHFLAHFARRYGMPKPALSPGLRATLLAHSWPGNIRELRNAIERSILLGLDEPLIDQSSPVASPAQSALPFPADMETIQRAAAAAMVARHNGNKTAAAESLGISRKKLYALLEPLAVSDAAATVDDDGDTR